MRPLLAAALAALTAGLAWQLFTPTAHPDEAPALADSPPPDRELDDKPAAPTRNQDRPAPARAPEPAEETTSPQTLTAAIEQLLPPDRAVRLATELERIGESIDGLEEFYDPEFYVPFEDYGPELLDIAFGLDRPEPRRTSELVEQWMGAQLNKQELLTQVERSLGEQIRPRDEVDPAELDALYVEHTRRMREHLEGPYKRAYDELSATVLEQRLYTGVPLLRRSGVFHLRADRGVERVFATSTGDARWAVFIEVLRGEVPAFDAAHDELNRLGAARTTALRDFLHAF